MRVTATYGQAVTQAMSTSQTVSRLATTAAASGTSHSARRVKMTVTVASAGLTPTGTLVVLRGGKVGKQGVTLVGGSTVAKLKRPPPARQRSSVAYSGDAATLASTSPVFKVKVRR